MRPIAGLWSRLERTRVRNAPQGLTASITDASALAGGIPVFPGGERQPERDLHVLEVIAQFGIRHLVRRNGDLEGRRLAAGGSDLVDVDARATPKGGQQ